MICDVKGVVQYMYLSKNSKMVTNVCVFTVSNFEAFPSKFEFENIANRAKKGSSDINQWHLMHGV